MTYLTTKEAARRIRLQLKVNYPKCKFSVTMESFSMGSAIDIKLMAAPFDAIDVDKQIQYTLDSNHFNHSVDEVTEYVNERFRSAQLNEYQFTDDYETSNGYSNGNVLTKEAWDVFSGVIKIVNETTAGNNAYKHYGIGKWDKPFVNKSL